MPPSLMNLTFLLRDWESFNPQITKVRKKVFWNECGLPLNFLKHKDDSERFHVVAYDDRTEQPVGTGCIHKDGHIGRIAVINSWREGHRASKVIIAYLLHIAKAQKIKNVWLNAHADMLDAFERYDFEVAGEPFSYCGVEMQKIEHIVIPSQ